jgi:hypothetical protein
MQVASAWTESLAKPDSFNPAVALLPLSGIEGLKDRLEAHV